ncbi:MAG: type II toxin-antitoxin system VapC family toxin [Solirubrobacteraceae bacterium]
MSAHVVCDASALVALLLDAGHDGQWVTAALDQAELMAPTLVGFETANIIRRQEIAGLISSDQAAQAHADLLELAIEHWPHDLLAHRAWELRHNLSIYDASYVALAEMINAPLITLDSRIAKAPGVRCPVSTPA